jgi:hypothetical protein
MLRWMAEITYRDGREPDVVEFEEFGTPRSTYCATNSNTKPDEWLHEKFICDIHVTDVAIAIFTGLLVLVTIPLALVGWAQTIVAHRTAKRELRAYIGFAGHRLSDRMEFIIAVKNFGQTPAHNVRGRLNWQRYKAGEQMPADFTFPDYGDPPKGSEKIFINPGQEYPWSFDGVVDVLKQLKTGEITLYLYGHFDYIDIFKKDRTSKFCYEGVCFGNGRAALRAFSRHNEAT